MLQRKGVWPLDMESSGQGLPYGRKSAAVWALCPGCVLAEIMTELNVLKIKEIQK
jgi:hypothetical protein